MHCGFDPLLTCTEACALYRQLADGSFDCARAQFHEGTLFSMFLDDLTSIKIDVSQLVRNEQAPRFTFKVPMTIDEYEHLPEELTLSQVAQLTGYSAQTVREHCRTGAICAEKKTRDGSLKSEIWIVYKHSSLTPVPPIAEDSELIG